MMRRKPPPRPTPELFAELARQARATRRRARAPYSKFKVGAALHSVEGGRGGTTIAGHNIENAVYPLTICAERVALFKAVSEGYRRFDAIAVIGNPAAPTTPCGACRQVLWELAGNIWVCLVGGGSEIVLVSDLLPLAFDSSDL